MYFSKNNLDLIAWYLFIRSCHRNFVSDGTFKTSIFCESLLQEVLKVVSEKSGDSHQEAHYLEFCRIILNRLNDQKGLDLEDLFSALFSISTLC